MNDLIIISCLFGVKFNRVHNSPDKENSYFFTNNKNLKNEIISKGWNYVFVDKELSSNYIISSLQAKYIKFLKFLDDFPKFKTAKKILYIDHKLVTDYKTLNEVKSLIKNNQDKSVIIRHDRKKKTNIFQEVNAAKKQERYAKNMSSTISFIRRVTATKEYSENVRICATGFLIYINRKEIMDLINNIYDKCMEHQQPECQIYWGIFSQKYKSKIKEIGWYDIKNIYSKVLK